MAAKILIVDDEDLIRWSLSDDLSNCGYKTFAAPDAKKALELVDQESPDLVLTDLRLGPSSGIDVLKGVRERELPTPVILMTAFADLASAVEALRGGAADYISKPLQLAGLRITIERVLETASLRSRLREAHRKRRERYNFGTIVSESPSMKEALGLARKIAAVPQGTVLILGDSGCGKDRMARAIHYESSRADQPMMEVSCTAIPADLLESELFGYEKGAFTGAIGQKKGLFESAAGGTVFLNEIGHMPMNLQAKLLRVIEDKTFKKVGGRDDITVDVRIIAATNEDLERAVKEERFRLDLYYRINVLSIKLRPLRERREDILPLADKLLDKLSKELGKPKPKLSQKTQDDFFSHGWPGNVRELRNVLERMMILGESDLTRHPLPAPAAAAAPSAPEPASGGDENLNIEEMEKELIRRALERGGANKQKVAQILGLSRDALRRRIEKFGFEREG